MKSESEIGSAITHQIRVSTGKLRKKVISFPERLDLFQHLMSSEVDHRCCLGLQIINLGKRLTDFGTTTLEIDWPKETDKGKWLLYLTKISSTGVDHMECSPEEEVNPRKLVSGNITLRL